MKRRSRPKKPKRDFEAEQIRRLTQISMPESVYRERLLADKAALEAKLKELFAWRNMLRRGDGTSNEEAREAVIAHHNELIRSISAELRAVKAQL